MKSINTSPATGHRLKRHKRPIEFEEVEPNEKWLWYAYKMGGFPELDEDITEQDFASEIYGLLQQYDWASIAIAKNPKKKDLMPVGLFTAQLSKHVAYPHVRWFPWATPRNKLEVTIRFLRSLVEDYTTIVYSSEADNPFFVHLCKYGIMRRVGQIFEFFEDGGKMIEYQVRKI